jgi:hypothetical protein
MYDKVRHDASLWLTRLTLRPSPAMLHQLGGRASPPPADHASRARCARALRLNARAEVNRSTAERDGGDATIRFERGEPDSDPPPRHRCGGTTRRDPGDGLGRDTAERIFSARVENPFQSIAASSLART